MAKGKIKKAFVAAGLILAMIPVLTGCTNYKIERAEIINDKITHVLQQENVVYNDATVQDFKLIGADVAKTAFEFGVKFNGVAELSNGDNAFTSVEYVVPSEYFIDLSKESSEKAVFNVLEKIVDNIKMSKCSITPVSDLSNVSDTLVKNTPTPFEKYNIADGMVYNISQPTFNDKDCSVSFEVKTLMELTKYKKGKGDWGVGIGFQGQVIFGYGIPITPTKVTGTFTTLDKFTFKVDKESYNQMKQDPKMVYDYVVNAINEQDRNAISTDRIVTSDVAYNSSDLLDVLSIQGLEDSLNK